jgi:hypothetical protein
MVQRRWRSAACILIFGIKRGGVAGGWWLACHFSSVMAGVLYASGDDKIPGLEDHVAVYEAGVRPPSP